MNPGDRVRIRWCPAHPEAVGSVGTVVAHYRNLGGFGADVVEVRYEAGGKTVVTPLAPENVGIVDGQEGVDLPAPASKDRTS